MITTTTWDVLSLDMASHGDKEASAVAEATARFGIPADAVCRFYDDPDIGDIGGGEAEAVTMEGIAFFMRECGYELLYNGNHVLTHYNSRGHVDMIIGDGTPFDEPLLGYPLNAEDILGTNATGGR